MIRSPFSSRERELIEKELMKLPEVMGLLFPSLGRYWRYLQRGENPSLDLELVSKINSRVQSIEEDIDRLREFILEEYERNPGFSFDLLRFLFPSLYDEAYQKNSSFSKILEYIFDIVKKTKSENHYLEERWSKILEIMGFSNSDRRVGTDCSSINYFSDEDFRYDPNLWSIALISYASMFGFEEKLDPFFLVVILLNGLAWAMISRAQ